MNRLAACASLTLVPLTMSLAESPAPDDPNLWLEDVTAAPALAWVRQHNEISQRELEASPDFKPIYDRLLAINESNARIPYVTKAGDFYYNFWRDAQHVRGLWRRTTLAEYRRDQPAWETVLDLDALATAEKENWVWKNAEWLRPAGERALLSLSRGGGDAVVVREFDLSTKTFVTDGFNLPEAKSDVTWRDRDRVFVGTDFGRGSLTTSGYPRIVKSWTRGTPLAEAPVIFEAPATDVGSGAWTTLDPEFPGEFVRRAITFFSGENFRVIDGRPVKLDLPADAEQSTFRDQILVTLRTDWIVGGKTYPAGALLAAPWSSFLAGRRDFAILFQPTPRSSLAGFSATRHRLIVNELDNVRNRLYVHTPHPDGTWSRTPLAAPEFGSVNATAIALESDDYFLTVTDFLTPTRLAYGTPDDAKQETLKQLPAFFDAHGLEITQHEAGSKDGTRIPYFQVARRGLVADGSHPTLLNGYGGFEVSEVPFYSGGIGAAWLERGGIFVLANIRGGGEFGPSWHQSAIKENRQRCYDDFAAVAEDLVARKIASPKHLGIIGGSNGGLLMGVMLTQHPELFNAIVCQVPLLDMQRYSHLLAGASWMGEYGDPDVPAEWAYISRYSPYQNVKADAHYPRVLFTTSTRDDRVHPGHARKMVAKMEAQHHDVLYYENTEGGHGGAANAKQQAYMSALAFTFLWQQLR